MMIHWTPNPLRAVVTLDDADRWALREAMEEDLGSDEDNAYMNGLHADYAAALRDVHVGDCMCVPCSCLKCWAETYLGIDTMPGADKYVGHYVAAAFGEQDRSLNEAITWLASYDPSPDQQWANKMERWNDHLPGWKKDAARAHAWLVAYRDAHFETCPQDLAREVSTTGT